jgi:hypothetical protein
MASAPPQIIHFQDFRARGRRVYALPIPLCTGCGAHFDTEEDAQNHLPRCPRVNPFGQPDREAV